MIALDDIKKGRILVVDDASANVILLDRILRGDGFENVTTTTDPSSVRELHREHRYDLILLDLQMPGMDGFQVMSGLKDLETEGYLPVLVVTADPDHKLAALQAGAKDFISKPFDRAEVLTRVHNMLQVRLLLREARTYGKLLEHYDALTGLPNRALYRELLAHALAKPATAGANVSVLILAIDRFKSLNDALGREFGGAVLQRIGARLAEVLAPMDVVARFERDEFGLIVSSVDGERDAAGTAANRIREALRPPVSWQGHEIVVTASIGIASSFTDSQDPDTLIKYADSALQSAKTAGGDTYRFCSTDVNSRALETLETELALRTALKRDEFVLHYQPKMHVASGEWSGAEALLRWNRPGHGLLNPSAFLPVLEETGLIIPVGAWVIETACRQIADWSRSGAGDVRVAVNVSGKQFVRDGFVDHVERAILANAISPDLLDVEITESSLMTRTEQTDRVLLELKALGVSIAIDDFGTGYSSLSYLTRFPIDTLKIDISFIRDLITNPDGGEIAVAIINMARSLKLKVIAEGVETEAQLEFLRSHMCDEIQGYYCSKPLPAADLTSLREVAVVRRALRPAGAPRETTVPRPVPASPE